MFPGEAAVCMGIVHVAVYDAAMAIEGGYEPDAIALNGPPPHRTLSHRHRYLRNCEGERPASGRLLAGAAHSRPSTGQRSERCF
jgi:hypothetical protein